LSIASVSRAREIIDMTGRKVIIPDKMSKLCVNSTTAAAMMYAVAPEMMCGYVFPPRDADKKFLPKSLWNLPTIGHLGGGGIAANPEMLLRIKPDLLIVWKDDNKPVDDLTAEYYKKLNIPYVFAHGFTLKEYPETIRFLGRLTHHEEHAEKMAAYASKILNDTSAAMSRVPLNQRLKVYYADGVDGLTSECDDSMHTELLRLLGNANVFHCHAASPMAFEKMSLEKILMNQPDVILAIDPMFYGKIYTDPSWQQVKAVREHRVYLIPRRPLNWVDRPPSFMRLLGMEWILSNLYPKQYPIDMKKETKTFYSVFLGVNLSDQDVQEILQQR